MAVMNPSPSKSGRNLLPSLTKRTSNPSRNPSKERILNDSALSVKRKYSSMLEASHDDKPRFRSEMAMQPKGPKIKTKAFNIPILDNKFIASMC